MTKDIDPKNNGPVEITIARVYVKDFSFESPKAPALFQDQLDHILMVFCPQTLFPYARANIDHSMTMGSLPPIMLAPINFEAMRAQRQNVN